MWRMGFGTLHYVLVPVKVDLGWRLRTGVDFISEREKVEGGWETNPWC